MLWNSGLMSDGLSKQQATATRACQAGMAKMLEMYGPQAFAEAYYNLMCIHRTAEKPELEPIVPVPSFDELLRKANSKVA